MRKRRTREHIIADLSVNHLERFILMEGHVPATLTNDYGYDMAFFTHDGDGESEDGIIFMQLKATDAIQWRQDAESAAFSLDARDLERWQSEVMPVVLVLYDAPQDAAYWLYVQSYLAVNPPPVGQRSMTIYLPRANRLDAEAIERMRQFKTRIVQQARGVIRHENG